MDKATLLILCLAIIVYYTDQDKHLFENKMLNSHFVFTVCIAMSGLQPNDTMSTTVTTDTTAAGIPNVYEIAAMSAGGLALLFTVSIFCLLCMILCLVIRVKRAVGTAARSRVRYPANGR